MPGLIDSELVGDQANLAVCEFALREELLTKRKAKRCGCVRCLADATDAKERVQWAAETGAWQLGNRKTRQFRA